MSHALVPVHIKPHLVPFLFKEFKAVDCVIDGIAVKAVKVTNHTSLGKFIRLLLEKTYTKPSCDKSTQLFLQVGETPKLQAYLRGHYRYVSGEASFLKLPSAGQEFLNSYLQLIFETAMMYYIYSWNEKKGNDGIEPGIIKFLSKYNLEEFNYSIISIRRDYYRKLKSGYFVGNIQFNPLTQRIETFGSVNMSQ